MDPGDMVRWRRRRKSVLIALAALALGAVGAIQLRGGGEETYRPGERTEGLTDRLGGEPAAAGPGVAFVEVAHAAGLVFRHFPSVRTGRLPEDMGSGVALGDMDGDGWTDAFLVNVAGSLADDLAAPGAGRSRLFRNRGDGTFEDVTASSGIDHVALGMAAAFFDPDSDGDLDLFVTSYGACHLYRNDGGGRFTDASAAAGIAELRGFWTGIAVADADRDGAMDVYVCGYVVYDEAKNAGRGATSQYDKQIPALINPSTFEPERNLLLLGAGDGTFREVGAAAGVDNRRGRSLAAVFTDWTGDGWPDIYVANDVSDNAFFVNQGDGTFVDLAPRALVADYRGAMGLSAADYDADLDLDLFVTHWLAQENALYTQLPRLDPAREGPACPLFSDDADRYGLGFIALDKVGWATRFFDLDNDGVLDLFVVNGSTVPEERDPRRLEPQQSHLFWQSPDRRRFFAIGAAGGGFFAERHVGRGGASFDYDLDGDEDLLVVLHGEDAVLLRNDGGNRRPSLRLRLRQDAGNRFAIGAVVTATIEGRRAREVADAQGSYLSQHAVGEVHFGLGAAKGVEELEVLWPDGERERAGPFPADSIVTWVRGRPPRVELLPGRGAPEPPAPLAVEEQRRFYLLRGKATAARVEGRLADAILLYRQALAAWPGHADCLYYLGNSLAEEGDEKGALAAFEELVAAEPRGSGGWMQIGFLRLPGGDPALDDLAAAEAAFARSAALNPEESRPIVQLGVVAMLQGRLEEAAERFRAAGRQNPRSIEARWFAGRVAWLAGDPGRAQALLAEAQALARAGGPLAVTAVASDEGATRSGSAMTAAGGIPLAPLLVRWSSLAEREPDAAREYGDG
ncbi:MAG: FG-GAP-like repeat-containing protein [Planctomycetota bacterium]